ncbi:S-layer homology domain-containing protein [Cytobacillus sp. NCCP-133]|uniref:S-layer homology domain-containing protein n=1 Tax=Cytobacillus sp. NCCP-133 TaxID=766848 RepID=UPI0022324429|nr:S-layer homology domain-containing protein [Cytobacillus sp. NCCP-133]GLB60232.1 hypothetical protein NCCP133_23640 [Cytobacillus sp. NCCP-133]
MKKTLSMLLVFLLMLGTFHSPAKATTEAGAIHYIALGDSLAAGMTPDKQVGRGYADMIADRLLKDGKLHYFTKEYSVPGATSKQVFAGIQKEDVKIDLQRANLVTISAGANDLLRQIKIHETGEFTYDSETVRSALAGVFENIAMTVKQIKELNPKIQVYVMGYYFPFPQLEGEKKEELIKISQLLNAAIEKAAEAGHGIFVPVDDKFGLTGSKYVPKPNDVHPSLEGYQLMADAFFEKFSISKLWPQYNDIKDSYWAYKEIMMLVNAGVLAGRSEFSFLPEKPITKAEAAAALAHVIPVTASVPIDPGFQDVDKNHPAYYEIAKMTEVGLFQSAEKFNPDSHLTRAQMSKIITLAFDLQPKRQTHFKDVHSGFWAKEYINTLASNDIVNGYEDGRFRPNDPTKRSHFAVILVRTMNVLK